MDTTRQRSFKSLFFGLLLASCIYLSSCGNASTTTTSTTASPTNDKGTLSGSVVTAPNCKAIVAGDGSACPARSVGKQTIKIEQNNGTAIATTTSDQQGHFSLSLLPGSYLVFVQYVAVGSIGKQVKTPVTITAGQTTTIKLAVDDGRR